MSRWPTRPLSSLGPIVDGDWILKENYTDDGVRLLQVGDVGTGTFIGKSNRFISVNRAIELGCTFLEPEDILISRMPDPLGRSCILPALEYPAITAVDVAIFRPDSSVLNRSFATYYMNSPQWFGEVLRYATGTTRPRISRSRLELLEIPVPPLSEQERIAKLLDEADALRKLRAEADRRTAELIPALFYEMFGGQDFAEAKLGDLTTLVTSGATPRGGEEIYLQSGPYFIRSQNVQMNRLDLSAAARLPEEVHHQMSRTKVQSEDVLLNITGASIGRVTWVDPLDREANVSQHVCLIRPKPSVLNSIFLTVFLSLPRTQSRILRIQAGASRQALNHQQVRTLDIPVPPLELQAKFDHGVKCIQGARARQREAGTRLETGQAAILRVSLA